MKLAERQFSTRLNLLRYCGFFFKFVSQIYAQLTRLLIELKLLCYACCLKYFDICVFQVIMLFSAKWAKWVLTMVSSVELRFPSLKGKKIIMLLIIILFQF